MELLPVAIGIGLVLALLFSETFSVTPGGMVVPGYLALFLDRPVDVALTFGAALVTFAIIRGFSEVMILYGRRRTALAILVGYLVTMGIRFALTGQMVAMTQAWSVIGFIIPGLIAIWLDRQGVIATVTASLLVAALVRLVLILTLGAELLA